MVDRYSKSNGGATIILGAFVLALAAFFLNWFKQYYWWVIIAAIFGGYCIVFYAVFKRDGYLSREYRSNFMDYFIIAALTVFFISAGFGLKQNSDSINLNLESKEYMFVTLFPRQANIELNQVRYMLDALNGRGTIQFSIHGSSANKMDFFAINTPEELPITHISMISQSGTQLVENKDYSKIILPGNNSLNYMKVSRLNNTALDGVSVFINFEGKLIPNGYFIFRTIANTTSNPSRETVNFRLGKYECQQFCWGNTVNAEIIPDSQQEGEVLKIKYPLALEPTPDIDNFGLEQEIKLMTFDSYQKKDKDNFNNFGFGLILSGLVLLGELIRKLMVLLVWEKEEKKSDSKEAESGKAK
jgi:hypothetical protein